MPGVHPYNVLITEPIIPEVIEFLKSFSNVDIGRKGDFDTPQTLRSVIAGYDGILCMLSTPVNSMVLDAGTRLKVVANHAVGFNNIDVKYAHTLGIHVTNTPDVLTEACGDFAIGLLLALSRKFIEAEKYLRDGKFTGWEPLGFLGPELRGKTLGIVGMGRIGKAFAQRARAFGMDILYLNRSRLAEQEEQNLHARYARSLEELLQNSDVVSMNCPLTRETQHMIGAKEFKLMKPSALFLNISRGPVVVEEELAMALQTGEIAGAALDVYEHEPQINPKLLEAPNCLLLPHIASATFETRTAIGMLAAKSIKQVLFKEPLGNISNLITL